ncbi:protein KRI1 [Tripterygium wilfordii]|uniref:Protein KRI1 n=1 Tax=Tripterygium wilfordii TaxID=458696 RepID=A0A7J7E374_TRIWF|nr:protein KRI1 [Tripterygium wilfordii]
MDVDDEEMGEVLQDEEIERQEEYEQAYHFRYEDNGENSYKLLMEGSLRQKGNARKEQRQSKEERMRKVREAAPQGLEKTMSVSRIWMI